MFKLVRNLFFDQQKKVLIKSRLPFQSYQQLIVILIVLFLLCQFQFFALFLLLADMYGFVLIMNEMYKSSSICGCATLIRSTHNEAILFQDSTLAQWTCVILQKPGIYAISMKLVSVLRRERKTKRI